MAFELRAEYPSGGTLYATVSTVAAASPPTVWNGSAFVAPVAGGQPSYAVPLAEIPGTGWYVGNFPVAIPAGTYLLSVYVQAGSTPAATDNPLSAAADYEWPGAGATGPTPTPTTTLLRCAFAVGGVPASATGDAVAATVTRADTGGVVAAGVAMAAVAGSPGVYTLAVTDPAPGLTYRWTVTGVVGGVPLPTGAAAVVLTTPGTGAAGSVPPGTVPCRLYARDALRRPVPGDVYEFELTYLPGTPGAAAAAAAAAAGSAGPAGAAAAGLAAAVAAVPPLATGECFGLTPVTLAASDDQDAVIRFNAVAGSTLTYGHPGGRQGRFPVPAAPPPGGWAAVPSIVG